MDARYAGALRAFLSHTPSEMPIDPGARDPLRERGPDAAPDLTPRVPTAAAPTGDTGSALLPLILAQLPLQPTYRLRRRPPTLQSALRATTNRTR